MDVDHDLDEARLTVKNLEIEDYGDIVNALGEGSSLESTVSFDCRWRHPIGKPRRIRNAAADQQFTGLFRQTHARVSWSAREKGFEFHSDGAETSTTAYAEVGEERNGVFFS